MKKRKTKIIYRLSLKNYLKRVIVYQKTPADNGASDAGLGVVCKETGMGIIRE